SLDALKQTAERPDRVGRFLGSLTNVLRNEDVTTVFTMETPELIGGIARTNFTALSALSQHCADALCGGSIGNQAHADRHQVPHQWLRFRRAGVHHFRSGDENHRSLTRL